jgi:predicted acetylornithine/succinylornithine family transaminase
VTPRRTNRPRGTPAGPGTAELAALDARHVMATYTRAPVAFTRGAGCRLWDAEGREYLDCLSGLAVTSLGHAHPEVAEAIAAQARRLLHVSNLYLNDRQPLLAARLDELLTAATGTPGRVFFANSGAEANECAIKLARRWGRQHGGPERSEVVSALGSFHGRTLATLAATGQPAKHADFEPLPAGFRHVPSGDLDALDAAVDQRVAAVLLEAVQGEGGVRPAPRGYLDGVRALCDERGVLLILDEVQTGLCRTGRWFAFEHFADVRPDVVTLAKALGNGMPIGACWARAEVAGALAAGQHATTFGGQPLAAAAALAVLEVMARDRLWERAEAAGARLAAGLRCLEGVTEVRGLGLLLAAELHPGIEAAAAAAAALETGLLVNAVTPSALRFAPPLVITDDEIDEACARLGAALDAAATTGPPVPAPTGAVSQGDPVRELR